MDKYLEEIFHIKKEVRILIFIFIGILLIGTIGYSLIKQVNLYQGLVLTLETLSFIHKEEAGIAKTLQIFLLFIGVVLIWFIMWTTLDLALEGHFTKYYFGVRNMDKIKKLSNHYIICGGGRVGENVARMLKEQKKEYVLLEKNSEVAKDLEEKGFLVLHGPSIEEDTLTKAQIKRAKFLVACTGEDAKNVLIILTAKELNPNLIIAARANEQLMVKKLTRAGAKHIFLPELLGANEVVKELSYYN